MKKVGMIRYSPRAVLLLFLVLHLTACASWQSIPTPRPAQFIEATQPDSVRVLTPDGVQVELGNPSVEGDQLVGANGVSVPLADILLLDVHQKVSGIAAYQGALLGIPLLVLAIFVIDNTRCLNDLWTC